METYISTKAYTDEFKTQIRKCGWGCGYVHIPKDHPILVNIVDTDWSYYLTPEGCPEEITYSEWDKEQEYYVIGFDTAHLHNDSVTHDEIYVTTQANAIKSLVNDFTAYDAYTYASKQIQSVTKKYSKYLI